MLVRFVCVVCSGDSINLFYRYVEVFCQTAAYSLVDASASTADRR